MGKPAKLFAVYDTETNELVMEGTAADCAEATGYTSKTIRKIAMGEYNCDKYDIVDLERREPNYEQKDAAKQWDEFCAPIRKKYGIPVYKPGKDGGNGN